jgi:hypothetical protein
MAETFTYKGFVVTIDQKDADQGDIIIDGHVFPCHQVPGELSMWHCDQAWYAPDTLQALGRHFVDFWYMFTDPNRCPPDLITAEFGGLPHGPVPGGGVHGHGAAPSPAQKAAAKKVPAKKAPAKKAPAKKAAPKKATAKRAATRRAQSRGRG